MKWYCEKCKRLHDDNELCPHIQRQLKANPTLLIEAADFTAIAGSYGLATTNALDSAAKAVNAAIGTNLSYEGTNQFARDIQVFKRLNEEAFCKFGAFASPEKAKLYLRNVKDAAKDNPRSLISLESKLTGASQEVDWSRSKQGQLSSVYQKNILLSGNAPGIDGITVNRFNGKTISRTTVKASKNAITKNSTGIKDVKKAIEKGTATQKDIIFAPKGAGAAAQIAGLENPVIEKNTAEQICASNERLMKKIEAGQATTFVTPEQLGQRMVEGAIIGAVVGVTISGITSYVRYQNGELTQQEAFLEVTEDTMKSAIVGAGVSAVTIFIPGGIIGFIGGMVVGIYLNAACTNVLDEVFGKGAYGAILNASGYIYGMAFNLRDMLKQLDNALSSTERCLDEASTLQNSIDTNLSCFATELEKLL